MPHQKILILDFGAQYTQLIARRIREIGVYCEVWAWDHDPAEITRFAPKGIVLSGGPESTTEFGAPAAPQAVFNTRVERAAEEDGTFDGEALQRCGPAAQVQ